MIPPLYFTIFPREMYERKKKKNEAIVNNTSECILSKLEFIGGVAPGPHQ